MTTKAEFLDEILNNIDEHRATFDYDDYDEGVAYVTTTDGDFKITIEKLGD